MIAVVVIAVIIIVSIVSMFPYKRVLAPEPAVTVKSASSILQVVGDFNYSTICIVLNSTTVSTVISEKGYSNSFLNFTLGGFIKGEPLDRELQICLNPIIYGHLAPNLEPEYLGFGLNEVSPKGLSNCALLGGLSPQPSKDRCLYVNTSWEKVVCSSSSFTNPHNLYRNFTIGLENESEWSLFHGYPNGFYNFALGNAYGLSMPYYEGTHYFRFSLSLPGLGETPYANITFETVYSGS